MRRAEGEPAKRFVPSPSDSASQKTPAQPRPSGRRPRCCNRGPRAPFLPPGLRGTRFLSPPRPSPQRPSLPSPTHPPRSLRPRSPLRPAVPGRDRFPTGGWAGPGAAPRARRREPAARAHPHLPRGHRGRALLCPPPLPPLTPQPSPEGDPHPTAGTGMMAAEAAEAADTAARSAPPPSPPVGPQAAVTCRRPASPLARPLREPPLLCAPPRRPAKVIPAGRAAAPPPLPPPPPPRPGRIPPPPAPPRKRGEGGRRRGAGTPFAGGSTRRGRRPCGHPPPARARPANEGGGAPAAHAAGEWPRPAPPLLKAPRLVPRRS